MSANSFFISVLSAQHVGSEVTALLGKLLTLDAEINSLLLRAKSHTDGAPWGDLADPFVEISMRYRDVWKRFESLDTSGRVHQGQVELKEAFAEAVTDLTELKTRFLTAE